MFGARLTPKRVRPGAGQESVWDYPRPPRLEPVSDRLQVIFAGAVIADTTRGFRVLETSHPPTYYFPPEDVRQDLLERAAGRTWCEWKGSASYWSIVVGRRRAEDAAWNYPSPVEAFAPIAGYFAFYPSKADECRVGKERVKAQKGDFYGGWITSRIVGPFKGGRGTVGW